MTDAQHAPGESKSSPQPEASMSHGLAAGAILLMLLSLAVGFVMGAASQRLSRPADGVIASGSSETTAAKPQQTVEINGHRIVADAGSRIIVEGSEDLTQPTASRTLTQAGESRGVGIATTEKGIANTQGELPRVDLNGSSSSGGRFAWHFEGLQGSSSYLLYIFAAIFGVIGAVLLYFGLRGLAFSMFALSAAFGIGGFLVETYPEVLLVVVLVGLAAGGYFLYDQWKKARQETSLKAVVAGVQAAPKEAQEAVKPKIAEAAGTAAKVVKDTITDIKAKLPQQAS